MKTTHRNYEDEAGDFRRICRFIQENNAQVRNHSTWCLGRFVDWKYALWGHKLTTPGFFSQNAQVWFDGFGRLAGLAISENGGPEAAIITTAGFRFLYEEMLAWAVENWGERGAGLAVEITGQQGLEAGFLEKQGFKRETAFYRSEFDLNQELVERYPLEAGYRIVAMQSAADYHKQLLLRQNAFAGKTDLSAEEIGRITAISRQARNNPIYHAGTDLCVLAPDGRYASGCEALIDTFNREADIERVCTHSDYRRRGLARIVIQECLYRLQEMGMEKAYITGYSEGALALYGSLGAQARTELWIYRQKR